MVEELEIEDDDVYVRVMRDSRTGHRSCWMWCPACQDTVRLPVDGEGAWGWNGSLTSPTFSPSIKIGGTQWPKEGIGHEFRREAHDRVEPGGEIVCHSYLVDGVWDFLQDCTHGKAGEKVPMVPLPDWLAR